MNIDRKKRTELLKSVDFIEQLCWLFDTHKKLNFEELPKIFRHTIESSLSQNVISNMDNNEQVVSLIGILPSILKDSSLFPNNASICEFATQVLNLEVTRTNKRSRYELIGMIVCETEKGNANNIDNLVDSITRIMTHKEKITQMRKSQGDSLFSWNEAIKLLTGES